MGAGERGMGVLYGRLFVGWAYGLSPRLYAILEEPTGSGRLAPGGGHE